MYRKLYISACACLMLAACVSAAVTSQPWLDPLPQDEWHGAQVTARPVGLGLSTPGTLAPGVHFAGGLHLQTSSLSPVRSLSDIKLTDDNGFIAVSDNGDLVRGTLVLDDGGQLRDVSDLQVRRLTRLDGSLVTEKAESDAEGLAIDSHGNLLISFEREHRVWSYGPLKALSRPVAVARPIWPFGDNEGMEALAAGTAKGPDGYRIAAEDGSVWDCESRCEIVVPVGAELTSADYRITGMDRDPNGGWFVVQRSYRPPMDARARVRHLAADGQLGPVLIELKLPGTTDNFEGIAATRYRDKTRLYLLSDDNNNGLQRTLMLAFDLDNAAVRPVR